MINKIKPNIWQFIFREFGSCVYLIKINNQNILVDTGSSDNKHELLSDLKELNIKPEQIGMVLLTHNHWDHEGNISLFRNARVYGNKKDFKDKKITDIYKLKIKEIKIIDTPGHTPGSISLLYQDVLFSGDTLFHNGIGRTDFPESSHKDMIKSLEELRGIDYKILLPGHT
ncbi:MAG TPA: MBL fold metallo-hydrolase [Candidatus Pacearchaeota archaeon]|nr:putative metallo-hydrolase [archaeon BMS3Abin17]HDK42338.1 MBL fold metallo-hydrolase [Candidatus Pacearchaeota archaeon]HDZ60292.1 MBL fold metallo-hydrolase [Candidatus Pacearchaeota archaeon]